MKKLFVISGRIPGDDDDTVHLVSAPDSETAKLTFRGEMEASSNLNDDDIEDLRASHGHSVYVISCTEIGEFNGNTVDVSRSINEFIHADAEPDCSASPSM